MDERIHGDRSLRVERLVGGTSTRVFQVFYYNNVGDAVNNWQYTHEVLPAWENGRINRMRVCLKAPPEMAQNPEIASTNFHVGTFLRSADGSRQRNESDNAHYYHYYNIGYEGDNWHQIIVDTHPNHQRGDRGSEERPNIVEPFPVTDRGLGYFDVMTYFYFDHKLSPTTYPAVFNFDRVEFYEDTNDEDVEQIYNLYGIYNTVTGEIMVGWKRNRMEEKQEHLYEFLRCEVRFYFLPRCGKLPITRHACAERHWYCAVLRLRTKRVQRYGVP